MDEDRFKNRKIAHDWLVENGYKVARGKFYNDCSAGFPVINDDKTISKFQVLRYGIDLQEKIGNPAGIDQVGVAEFQLRKLKAETEIAEDKAEKTSREKDRNWVHSTDAWAVVASLVNQIRDSARHHLYAARRDIVGTAVGNQDRADEVYVLVESIIDNALNEVAGKSINIDFVKE